MYTAPAKVAGRHPKNIPLENKLYHGKGELENPQGFFKGDIEHGYYHGEGYLIEYRTYYDDTGEVKNSGFKYNGGFKEGKFHGNGEYTFEVENEVIEGEWKDGEIWNGTTKDKSGKIICKWVDGEKQK